MRMHVYHFRCYWPSNLILVVTCVTYVPNLTKIGQKLQSLSWMNGIVAHRQTHAQVILYQSNAMHCIDRQ